MPDEGRLLQLRLPVLGAIFLDNTINGSASQFHEQVTVSIKNGVADCLGTVRETRTVRRRLERCLVRDSSQWNSSAIARTTGLPNHCRMSDRGGHGIAGAAGGTRAPRSGDLPAASHDDRAESTAGQFELSRPRDRCGERRDRHRASHLEHHTTVTRVTDSIRLLARCLTSRSSTASSGQ